MDTDVSFGRWLKRRRKSLDLTQALLAERVHCSLATIQKIESEERKPSRELSELLAAALEIPVADRALFAKVARGERSSSRLAHSRFDTPLPFVRAPRTNLPAAATSLIGRGAELAELGRLMAQPDCRLLTITGEGGIGKTRLALGVAAACEELYVDGAFYIPLAPLGSSEFIAPAIADAVGLTMAGPDEPRTQVLRYLRDKDLLLVLDNMEHLVDDLSLLREILQYAPHVKLLATSRQRLEMQGEVAFHLRGLPPPEPGRAADIVQNSAVQLFLYAAQRLRPDFSLTEQNREAVAGICRLVEGMPLGIELAAAWINVLSCDEIATEIQSSLDFLATTGRERPERHRSLRAVFDHSWGLLSMEEQRVLRKLSVFRGGLPREAAEGVAGAGLPVLLSLSEKSLLHRTAAGRFDLHEAVRQYSGRRLEETGEATDARQRHFDFYTSMAEAAEPYLASAQWKAWSERLEADHDNLRAALEWGSAQADGAESVSRLAASLYWFWFHRGDFSEGRAWLEKTLSGAEEEVSPAVRARGLYGAGGLALAQGHFAAARWRLEESVALWRSCGASGNRGLAYALTDLSQALRHDGELPTALALSTEGATRFREVGDAWGLAYALDSLGLTLRDALQFAEARRILEESIDLWRGLGDTWGLAYSLHTQALVALRQGDYEAARSRAEEALALRRASTNPQGTAYSFHTLGVIALNQDDVPRAKRQFQRGYELFEQVRDEYGIASTLHYTGQIALLEGDAVLGQSLIEQALAVAPEVGPKWFGPFCLARLAGVIAVRGSPAQAVQLWEAFEALMAAASSYVDTADRIFYDRVIAPTCLSLDEGIIREARAEGRLLSLEQALRFGLAAAHARKPTAG